MLVSGMLISAGMLVSAAAPSAVCMPSATCCVAGLEAAQHAWRAHRAARRISAAVDAGGQLESQLLDDAQNAAQQVAGSVRALPRAGCLQPYSCVQHNSTRRQCRVARLTNFTSTAQQHLDDAAAAVLFGDSEDTMLAFANVLPAIIHRQLWAATELERCGRRCKRLSSAKAPVEGVG